MGFTHGIVAWGAARALNFLPRSASPRCSCLRCRWLLSILQTPQWRRGHRRRHKEAGLWHTRTRARLSFFAQCHSAEGVCVAYVGVRVVCMCVHSTCVCVVCVVCTMSMDEGVQVCVCRVCTRTCVQRNAASRCLQTGLNEARCGWCGRGPWAMAQWAASRPCGTVAGKVGRGGSPSGSSPQAGPRLSSLWRHLLARDSHARSRRVVSGLEARGSLSHLRAQGGVAFWSCCCTDFVRRAGSVKPAVLGP